MNCTKCGRAGRPVEASVMGSEYVKLGATCDACWDESMRKHALWRAEFERLLMRMSRTEANTELIRRINAGEAPPLLPN